METHSSTLAWIIPWTEKPGGLQSMGSQRVGYTRFMTESKAGKEDEPEFGRWKESL